MVAREGQLLSELKEALRHSARPVREVEVSTELSIALGRQRPSVSCGGCSTPLSFEGVPARTVVGLKTPFRLVYADPPGAPA